MVKIIKEAKLLEEAALLYGEAADAAAQSGQTDAYQKVFPEIMQRYQQVILNILRQIILELNLSTSSFSKLTHDQESILIDFVV